MILALLPCSAAAEQAAGQTAGEQSAEQPTEAVAGDRVVLTIGDSSTRSGNRYNEELGLWQYLAELAGSGDPVCLYVAGGVRCRIGQR